MTTIEELNNILEGLPESLRQTILEYAEQVQLRFKTPNVGPKKVTVKGKISFLMDHTW